jgi:predicted solute-binding protein
MAVNDYAVSLGADGRAALERLYGEAYRRGLLASVPPLDVA